MHAFLLLEVRLLIYNFEALQHFEGASALKTQRSGGYNLK